MNILKTVICLWLFNATSLVSISKLEDLQCPKRRIRQEMRVVNLKILQMYKGKRKNA